MLLIPMHLANKLLPCVFPPRRSKLSIEISYVISVENAYMYTDTFCFARHYTMCAKNRDLYHLQYLVQL